MVELPEIKKHVNIIEICGKCGDCGTTGTQITTAKRHVDRPCAVKNVKGFEAYDARGRILVLKNLLDGKLDVTDDILEWAYSCTTCGSCKETCLAIEGGIDTPMLMEALRKDLVDAGFTVKKHGEISRSIEENKNPYNEPAANRLNFLEDRPEKTGGGVLLYIGCTASYREQQIARATMDLFELLGIDYFILEDEECCGSILKRFGYMDQFNAIAESNIEKIKQSGAKKVVFPCAGCFRTFKKDYPEENSSGVEYYHLVEFLDEFLKENPYKFKFKKFQKISYHDPCHLGRHCEVYEAPRNILKNIDNTVFVELNTARNYSHCCGAGGGVKSSDPDLAKAVAGNRWKDALEKDVQILVSTCPFCEKNLKDGLPDGKDDLAVVDVSEILLQTAVKELSSQIVDAADTAEKSIGKQYMEYLSRYPEIFSDLATGSIMDFTIYNTIEELEDELDPADAFNVGRTTDGIQIVHGRSDNPDLELALSIAAVQKLTKTTTKDEYSKIFGEFYNEPDEEEGWIDFILNKRTKTLIKMGYGKFAEAAGILEDESQI